MKKTVLLVLLAGAVSLNACVPSLYPEVDERLTTLPVQPHNGGIDVFFTGEWPKEEYVKLAALETRGGENVPYINLVNSLKAKARAYGADAVVVQDKNFMSDVHTTVSDAHNRVVTGTAHTTGWSTLTGVAIKYKKNLDTGLMPKNQQVEVYDPVIGGFQPLLSLAFTPDGEIKAKEELHENATLMYNNYIEKYILQNLYQRGPGWSYRMQEGYVVERELHKDGMLQKRMEFDYDSARRIKEIRIREIGGAMQKISYTYNEAGQLTRRDVFKSDKPYIQEEYTYDAKGQAGQVLIYNTNLPEKLPLLRSTYTYYTLEEI